MPQDRTNIVKGQFMTGGCHPAHVKQPSHVTYGQRLPPRTSLAEIEDRLAAAMKRLDEIAATVKLK